MNVLQVTHYMPPHPGGIERVADSIFRGYLSAGLDAHWIAARVPDDAPVLEDGRRQRVPVVNLLETMLAIPVPIWGVSGVQSLRRAVRDADVVHVHDCLYPSSALAIALARRAGTPTVLTQHVGFLEYASPIINAVESAAYRTLGRAVLHRATRLVLATPAAEAHVRGLLGGLPSNVSVIPNGIDLDRFRFAERADRDAARASLQLSSDAPVVLFVGRLVHTKGVALVLAAAEHLSQMRFVVLGDGPLAPAMTAAPPNVRWVREVPQEEMPVFYQAASCLVLPSHGEGLPLVIQEAFASGLTAVVSDDSAYVAPLASNGLLRGVPRDTAAIAASIDAVVKADDESVRRAARAYAEQQWDVRKMQAAYVQVVRELATRSESPMLRTPPSGR